MLLLSLSEACYLAYLVSTAWAKKVTSSKNVPKNAILLSNVESLTFRAGKLTTSRRTSAVPQLKCIGAQEICDIYTIDVMRCKNEGSDYEAEDIQWTCQADLPEEFKLGSTDVSCEGYASSDDPYVLKGSCGVEYRLILTQKGEERFPDVIKPHARIGKDNIAPVIFYVIFFAVLAVILRGMCTAASRNPPRLGGARRPRGSGNFGSPGGYDDGDDDPPPPYDDDFPNSHSKPRSQRSSYSANSSRTTSQSWRPGPWTAAAAGAGLGYALGRNTTRPQRQPARQSSGGPSSSSFSSTTHQSTGFGGTSRR